MLYIGTTFILSRLLHIASTPTVIANLLVVTGLTRLWPNYEIIIVGLSVGVTACLSTTLQMTKCDPTVHVLWVWLLLAASAPFMRDTWKVWVAGTMVILLVMMILLTRFAERLPGQNWISKFLLLMKYISPEPNAENRQMSFWGKLGLRCFANICTSITSVLATKQIGLGALVFPYASLCISLVVSIRIDGLKAAVFLISWWVLIAWCTLSACLLSDPMESETLILLMNANLAHLLVVCKEKDPSKTH